MSELLERCRGKWPALLVRFGIDRRYLSGKHGPCPICGSGKDRFRFSDLNGDGMWICTKCGAGNGFQLLMQVQGWDFKQVAYEVERFVDNAPRKVETRRERSEKSLRAAMNRLWGEGKPVTYGDPVCRYLNERGIGMDEWPPTLRYVERCRYQDDTPSYHPAMIAKVSAPDGRPCTIHRTYLGDGCKADVEAPRRLMPGKTEKGCAVRLAVPGPVLGIAEGIENAFAAHIMFDVPVWSAISAAMLMAWEPPAGVEEVVIFGDNDASFAGQSASYALASRLTARDLTVRVEIPPRVGSDWNDVLMERRRIAA